MGNTVIRDRGKSRNNITLNSRESRDTVYNWYNIDGGLHILFKIIDMQKGKLSLADMFWLSQI